MTKPSIAAEAAWFPPALPATTAWLQASAGVMDSWLQWQWSAWQPLVDSQLRWIALWQQTWDLLALGTTLPRGTEQLG